MGPLKVPYPFGSSTQKPLETRRIGEFPHMPGQRGLVLRRSAAHAKIGSVGHSFNTKTAPLVAWRRAVLLLDERENCPERRVGRRGRGEDRFSTRNWFRRRRQGVFGDILTTSRRSRSAANGIHPSRRSPRRYLATADTPPPSGAGRARRGDGTHPLPISRGAPRAPGAPHDPDRPVFCRAPRPPAQPFPTPTGDRSHGGRCISKFRATFLNPAQVVCPEEVRANPILGAPVVRCYFT